MATRVVVEHICDQCNGVAVEPTDVHTVKITVDKTEYEVDLCEMCLSQTGVLEHARKIKAERKTKAGTPSATSTTPTTSSDGFPCSHPGCDFVAQTQSGLGPHNRKHRGKA